MKKNHYKLTPSDFAFLWEECKRCFYLKVVSGFPRPFRAFPKIFTIIDSQMKNYYLNMRTKDISLIYQTVLSSTVRNGWNRNRFTRLIHNLHVL